MKKIFLFLILLLINQGILFAQEQITITTYYPSPHGSYDELGANKLAVDIAGVAVATEYAAMANGDAHIGRSLIIGAGGGSGFAYDEGATTSDGVLLVKDRIGIGNIDTDGLIPTYAKLYISGGPRGGLYGGTPFGILGNTELVGIYMDWDSDSLFVGLRDYGGLGDKKDAVLIFGDNDTDNFRIQHQNDGQAGERVADYLLIAGGTGNVGIGTVSPQNRLDVEGAAVIGATYSGTNTAPANGLLVEGNVGIGTTNPSSQLEVTSSDPVVGSLGFNLLGGNLWFSGGSDGIATIKMTTAGGSINFMKSGAANISNMSILDDGNVGIGTTTPGSRLTVAGSIAGGETTTGWVLGRGNWGPDNWLRLTTTQNGATYHDFAVRQFWANGALRFDLAEITPVKNDDNLEPGDVVCIDKDKSVRMARSKKAYDSLVSGIVSDPNTVAMVIGGDVSPEQINTVKDKKPIALTGRVLCKVSGENGPIEIGDLLVTSSIPGHAMKGDLNEIKPGMILGKALEPFSGKSGKIMVWVTSG